MSPITLEFFGAPHIERDGAPVHVTRRKAIGLLVYLAVTEQAHGRDVLAALLWPELGHKRVRANLRHALYTLNDALGQEWLDSADGQLALPQQPGLHVDVAKFRRLLAAPAAHNHPSPHLCDSCIQALTLAANVYRGDFLAGFSLPDSAEFDTWQLLQREALQRELSSVLDQLAHVYAEAGRRQFDLAIAYARRWLALDPLHEPAHRTLMRFYAESGDRAAAVRQYEECVRVLAEELSVEPEPETGELVEQIRKGLLLAEDIEGLQDKIAPSVEMPVHNLPAQATSFIGRAREMDQVAARLADPDCRLLAIVGPGGSGKTRLAIQTAAAQTAHFRDGVHFVDLSPVESPGLLATTIARSLDTPELGTADPRRRLCDFLRPKQMLLVLDNLEHLLDAVDLLPELLRAAPDLKLLVTSRERLNVREEWLSPLEGLSAPPGPPPGLPPTDPDSMPDLEAYDATLLFLNRMRRLRPNYVPDSATALADEDAAAIAAICRLLEGMPLAIELAAGWTRTLSLRELQDEIQHSLNVLSSTLRDVAPRLRSMRAAFDHSWRLLSTKEKSILRQMSVFRGGCTRDAAEKVTGATVADLAGLVDKSWLRLRDTGRYTIHELARQYCEEKLNALGDQAGEDSACEESQKAVRRRHCVYYGAYVSSIIGSTNYRPATLGDILVEFGNLRAALRSAVDNHELQEADNICWSVFFVGDMMGWLHFSIQTLDTVVPALENRLADPALVEPERTEVAHVLAAILHTQFCQYGWLGMLKEAGIRNERLVSLASMMQPGRTQIFWHALGRWEQGGLAHDSGDYSAARQIAQESLALYEADNFECLLYGKERGAAFWQFGVLSGLGRSTWAVGEYAASEEYFIRCMALHDATGEQRFKGMHLGRHAQLVQTTGDYVRAEELARQGLRLSETYGDRIGTALGHCAVGRVFVVQGRYESARRHLFKSLETGRHSGHLDIVMRSLCELGRIDLAQGKPADARHRFENAYAAFERVDVGHNNALAGVWLGLGWCALAEEDAAPARRMFEKAHDGRGVTAFEIQESDAGLAHILLQEGESVQAAELLQQVSAHPATAHDTRLRTQRAIEEAQPS